MVINKKIVLLFLFFVSVLTAQQKDTVVSNIPKQNINATIELRNHLDDIFNDSNFLGATWGVFIKSLKTGEILYKRNADKFFIPASNIKLFTTAAALLLLGENYRYKTRIYAEGDIYKGTLYGNLIIQGSGDPTISNRFIAGDVDTIFKAWSDSLSIRGIKKISGNLLGDDDAFDEKGYGTGWMRDYEYAWFAAASGALSFNNNVINIYIKPTSKDLP
ncbi:MAG TPA: D-alanyl-D-alanine carboxypeptidase, partial [Melioribacteraceae bacterium]|nr:D-alanyl-D-alanine carboxypeptidase [Melioribacteraceae bacterium]